MGSLGGHLIPGSFFILFSMWWSYIASIRYFQSKLRSTFNKEFCVSLPFCRIRRLPVESYFKLIFSLMGVSLEFLFGFEYVKNESYSILMNESMEHYLSPMTQQKRHSNESNEDVKVLKFNKNSLQHICMYFSFVLGSVIEILLANRGEIPYKLDFVFGVFGFLIESLLFTFHLHGRSLIDIHVHTLLLFSIVGCILFICLEIYDETQILFTYGRILCTLLQGLWFCQVGFILYTPKSLTMFMIYHKFNFNDEHVS
jgi:hypothetical protein